VSERWHLAQVNLATLRAPLTDPATRSFVDLLAPGNALADAAPGFVWRCRRQPATRRRSGSPRTTG
jgi:hypothetical protein